MVDRPTLPPAPRPFHTFTAAFSGVLQLTRCTTFVRLLRAVLDVCLQRTVAAVAVHSAADGLIVDLALHLISVALYEDELELR